MENLGRNILIPFMLLLAISMTRAVAQTNPQLSLSLVGQDAGQYITPAGQTTTMKLEILNVARSEVYLLQGKVYLDPDLSGTWALIHSEQLGGFRLGFLQSAIWTFDLTVPAKIRAANVTQGMPQVSLLVKIVYQDAGEPQNLQEGLFSLHVPGATVQQGYGLIWYALVSAVILAGIGIARVVTKRRRLEKFGEVYSERVATDTLGYSNAKRGVADLSVCGAHPSSRDARLSFR
ncbi:MAG TPA: hypothetical protein VED86_02125 [archaeon]|nr:hypothetical protein [archaeon]